MGRAPLNSTPSQSDQRDAVFAGLPHASLGSHGFGIATNSSVTRYSAEILSPAHSGWTFVYLISVSGFGLLGKGRKSSPQRGNAPLEPAGSTDGSPPRARRSGMRGAFIPGRRPARRGSWRKASSGLLRRRSRTKGGWPAGGWQRRFCDTGRGCASEWSEG